MNEFIERAGACLEQIASLPGADQEAVFDQGDEVLMADLVDAIITRVDLVSSRAWHTSLE